MEAFFIIPIPIQILAMEILMFYRLFSNLCSDTKNKRRKFRKLISQLIIQGKHIFNFIFCKIPFGQQQNRMSKNKKAEVPSVNLPADNPEGAYFQFYFL
jgi:hypothetical protein